MDNKGEAFGVTTYDHKGRPALYDGIMMDSGDNILCVNQEVADGCQLKQKPFKTFIKESGQSGNYQSGSRGYGGGKAGETAMAEVTVGAGTAGGVPGAPHAMGRTALQTVGELSPITRISRTAGGQC